MIPARKSIVTKTVYIFHHTFPKFVFLDS
jgi:hypothetical protein